MASSPHTNQTRPVALTLPGLARTVGVEYRTLHTWLRRGLFTPSILAGEGSGHPNLFDEDDLAFVRWLVRLRNLGLTPDGMALAAEDPAPLVAALEARP